MRSANEERERRILASAADLFAHYGYDKTTVDDIARQAGVSKGAIYLHFKGKDDLFERLLLRELKRYAEKWLELIEADPQGGTIGGMYKNSLYALSSSAFMTAIFKQDGRVLGNYLRKPDNFFRTWREGQERSDRFVFVKRMQEAGAIRPDLNPRVVAHIMDMLAYGLVGLADVFPSEQLPPVEDVIEGIADIMDRALTPDEGGDSARGKAVLQQIFQASRQQFEAIGGPHQPGDNHD